MVQAEATAKFVRTSAQKAGLVLDLIRGRAVTQALSTLKFTRKTETFFFLGLGGAVFGFIGAHQVKRSGGWLTGLGLARAG